MATRKIFKLEIYGNLITGNETRQIEARNWSEAVKIKDGLLNGRPYYSLTQVVEVTR